MIRRILTVGLVTLTFLGIVAPAAQAVHRETRCELAYSENDGKAIRWCVTLNVRDTTQQDVEALAFVDAKCGECPNERPWVQFDWVHLYKEDNAVRTTGASPWEKDDNYPSWSTSWYDLDGISQCKEFQAVARISVRWPNGYVWTSKLHSGTRLMNAYSEKFPPIPAGEC